MAGQRILMLTLLLFAASAAAQDDEPPVDEPAPVEAPPADVPPPADAPPADTAPAPAHAGTVVYKCTNKDGSVVFSEDPCSSDPAQVETIDTSSALRTGSGGHQAEIAASVADSDCRDRAYKSTHDDTQIAESNRHIAEYEQRRQDLQSQPAYAGGAPAGGEDNAGGDDANADTAAAAPAPDNAQAIAEIDAAIAKEREFQDKAQQGSDAAYQAALRACDEQLQRASQPPAAEPPPAASPEPAPDNGGG